MRFVLPPLFVLLLAALAPGAEAPPDYAERVAPIFTKYCNGCHNATDAEGKLVLEDFASIQRGGGHGAAILPGDSGSSRMIRVMTGKAKPAMPPKDELQPTPDEIAILAAWIDGGAKGPAGAEPDRATLRVPAVAAPPGAGERITSLAHSPDGKTLAIGRFRRLELRTASSSKFLGGQSLGGQGALPGKVNSIEFSRDGQQVLIASGVDGLMGEASIWNVADGSLVRKFGGHRDALFAARFSPDGQLVATAGYDRKIVLWNAATGEQVRTLTGHNDAVYDLAFRPDGAILASASGDKTVKIWHVATGERLDTRGEPLGEQFVVRFDPSGQFLAAGGADNRLRVWRIIASDKPVINPLLHARFAHEGTLVGLAFAPDGKSLVTSAEDRTLKLWETDGYTESRVYPPQSDVAYALSMDPSGKTFVVGRMDGSLESFETAADEHLTAKVQAAATSHLADPAAAPADFAESEPNDGPAAGNVVTLPVKIKGSIRAAAGPTDADCFRFEAQAGETWIVEVNASRNGSQLDSFVEILDAEGHRIERVLLQAVRDSYFTFAGKDSDQRGDFRLFNSDEMIINDYVYAGGEVVKLFAPPRGPDSGYWVYPQRGSRRTYFDTTARTHALNQPCYVVRPYPPGTSLVKNGLPVFPIYYENDDDSLRKLGRDSRLTFTAPASGTYVARLTDARGFAGEKFEYELMIRGPRPGFQVRMDDAPTTIPKGSGKSLVLIANREDGFDGEIVVDVKGLPPGFTISSPITIAPGQQLARAVIMAAADAPAPTPENAKTSLVEARAQVDGQEIVRQVGTLGEMKLGDAPKLTVRLSPAELVIHPGETITATLTVDRRDFPGILEFGDGEDTNLPHGVRVDNIGLNGILMPEGTSERTVFLTADPWVPESTRPIFFQVKADGGQASPPVTLSIRRPTSQ